MQLIVKNADGSYSERDHKVGDQFVGVSVRSVRFTNKDLDDPVAFLINLREVILPRMPPPTEADFLPVENGTDV